MTRHYDYIITGAGLAGLSLLMRMMKNDFFNDKKILVLDSSPKTGNDHTWCFWEKRPGIFEPVVTHTWSKVQFFSLGFSGTLNLYPYTYKMIQASTLYAFVKEKLQRHPNIEWEQHEVKNIGTADSLGFVEIAKEIITADWVFNSILFGHERKQSRYHLLQHFKGWTIETPTPVFDAATATFMDFRIDQEPGLGFMYVLPVAATKALVEYTLFSEALLGPGQYEKTLRDYIGNRLGISGYTVSHEESGVIPMTDHRFPLRKGKVVYMGIAGGQVKGSSGYAFNFIQQRTSAIVKSILTCKNNFDSVSFADRKFRLYDNVLLNVLQNRKMPGDRVFASLFEKNPPARVFKFLDNQTNILEDLAIMRSVPQEIFFPAAAQELFRR